MKQKKTKGSSNISKPSLNLIAIISRKRTKIKIILKLHSKRTKTVFKLNFLFLVCSLN